MKKAFRYLPGVFHNLKNGLERFSLDRILYRIRAFSFPGVCAGSFAFFFLASSLLPLSACKQEYPDQIANYCKSWSPVAPPWCYEQGYLPMPVVDGWQPIDTAPLLEWVLLLLPDKKAEPGFQSERGTFLIESRKGQYTRVYPLAWRREP